MTRSQLADYWRLAGETLGFAVESPFEIVLPSGHRVSAQLRLPEFGAQCGMLLSDTYDDFSMHSDELVAAGFGYSVLSAPEGPPDQDEIVDVLQDWGWSASSAQPAWLDEA